MSDDTRTGIPDPDKRGHWLVPPWPPGANFHEVVLHFILRHPRLTTNTAHVLAYYAGFQKALDGAPTDEHRTPLEQRWYRDMRACVDRCVQIFRDKHAAESPPKRRPSPAMSPAA